MSDAVVKSLLSTCKHTLKSLSEVFTTLDSIDALPRLREDGEAMEALKLVDVFCQFLLLSSTKSATSILLASGTSTETHDDDDTSWRIKRSHVQLDADERNRPESISKWHRVSNGEETEEHTSEDRGLQDGRGEAVDQTQVVPKPPPDYSDLLGPTSSLTTNERFYSLLVYFPAFFLSQKWVTVKEKDMLLAIIRSASGDKVSGAVRQLTTTIYPRIRLITCGTSGDYSAIPSAVIIMDDDAGRLRRIQKKLHSVQYQRWSNLDENWMRRDLFFVRSWGERPAVLIFKFKTWDQLQVAPSVETQHAVIDALFQRYPILASHQRDSSSSGPRISVGKAALYHGQLHEPYHNARSAGTRPQSTCFLVPLFNVHPRYPDTAFNFAQDFAVEHSGGVDNPLNGIACEIYVDRMLNPEHWSWSGGAGWSAG